MTNGFPDSYLQSIGVYHTVEILVLTYLALTTVYGHQIKQYGRVVFKRDSSPRSNKNRILFFKNGTVSADATASDDGPPRLTQVGAKNT